MENLEKSFHCGAVLFALLLSAAALCFTSGCDTYDTYNGLASPAAPPYAWSSIMGPNEVWIQCDCFHSRTITIQQGTTIRWTNKDPSYHTVTSDNGLFASGSMDQNGTYEHRFDATGTFPYHCLFTPNLHGMVIVQ